MTNLTKVTINLGSTFLMPMLIIFSSTPVLAVQQIKVKTLAGEVVAVSPVELFKSENADRPVASQIEVGADGKAKVSGISVEGNQVCNSPHDIENLCRAAGFEKSLKVTKVDWTNPYRNYSHVSRSGKARKAREWCRTRLVEVECISNVENTSSHAVNSESEGSSIK